MSTASDMRAAVVYRLALIALAADLAGCATAQAPLKPTLDGSNWQITAINGQATPRTDMYQMEFKGGRASGRFGCNRFSGNYTSTGSALTLGPTMSTRMGCPEPAAAHEREGLAVLGQEAQLAWAGDQLTISNTSGSIALERLP
jgi:heat shock protein HslJ